MILMEALYRGKVQSMPIRAITVLIAVVLVPTGAGLAQEVILPDVSIAAWDQPELYGLLKDGTDILPFGSSELALEFFVDTGASGLVLSKIIVDELGLSWGDFIGEYEEIGIGGTEWGDVTRPFTVKLLNGALDTVPEILEESDFDDYGQFSLWARRTFDILDLWDPINIAGMPIIKQRVMVMDPTPIGVLERMQTFLLPHGDPDIPTTQLQVHVPLILVNFLPDEPPPAQTFPSSSDNPLVPNIQLRHGQRYSSGMWLLDTGAGSNFISIVQANTVGLTDQTTLEDILPEADFSLEVGGIGGTLMVPGFVVDEVRVPTYEGIDLVFRDTEVLVIDVAGLDGVFGMPFLVPSMSMFRPVDGPGYFERIVVDSVAGQMGLDIFDDAYFIENTGDLDGDGDADLDDAALLAAAMNGPGQAPGNAEADLDDDGDCDLADAAIFAAILGGQMIEIVGDVDGDDDVDWLDAALLSAGMNGPGQPAHNDLMDLDDDGDCDMADVAILNANFTGSIYR
jgi:hypothetical protein